MIDYLEDEISEVSLVDKMQEDIALKVVNSARISYNNKKETFDEKDKTLCRFLMDNEHTSPFRHSYYTFHIKAPLFLFRQLMKYQVGSVFRTYEVDGKEVKVDIFDHLYDDDKGCSWNEISGRYTQTSEQFYIPKKLRSNPSHGNKQSSGEYKNPLQPYEVDHMYPESIYFNMATKCKESLYLYNQYIKNGVAKEICRMFLPQAIYSEAYWTVSLQSILHFLKQRGKKESQLEIRLLALAIYTLIEKDIENIGITKNDLFDFPI